MRKRRIAWLSPLPPQRSGIANYSYALLRELRTYFEIDLFCEQEPADEIRASFAVYPLSRFAGQRQSYDETSYHLGNNREFHRGIYKLAWEFPATLVLHDYNIYPFMHSSFWSPGDERLIEQALSEGYGAAGYSEFERLKEAHPPRVFDFPMSHAIVKRSRKVIVHNRWMKRQFPADERLRVIPHFAEISERPLPEEIATYKASLGIADKDFVVTTLGFINKNKLPELQVETIGRLIADGYPIKMVFAGELSVDLPALPRMIAAQPHAENFLITGYQNKKEYYAAIFASDVVVNLRHPSHGEASGTLMESLAAGKPTIVSDVNQYREFPDNVCWKVAHDEHEGEVLYAYLEGLLDNKNWRVALARNSLAYVRSVLSMERVLPLWVEALST